MTCVDGDMQPIPYHFELSCQEFTDTVLNAAARDEALAAQLQEWRKAQGDAVKDCPSCGVMVFKTAG